MGLELFEVRFFFWEKFTKFDLALMKIIKNRSKVVYRLSAIFLTIWLKNCVFVKRLMGTPLDWKFWTHDFFFQFRVWPHGVKNIKNWFGTIKDLSIWFFGNKGIFVSQNFYRYTILFSRFIFRLRDNQSKMCFKTPLRGDTQPQWKKSVHCVALSELFRMFFFYFSGLIFLPLFKSDLFALKPLCFL